MNRGTLSTERHAAGKRYRGTGEFADDRLETYESAPRKNRRFGLWNTASPCLGKETEEQDAANQSTQSGNQNSPPRSSAWRVQPLAKILCDNDKRHDHQANECSENQREYEEHLILVSACILAHPSLKPMKPTCCFGWCFVIAHER